MNLFDNDYLINLNTYHHIKVGDHVVSVFVIKFITIVNNVFF